MSKLPWIVRKTVDFDAWFNKHVLGWSIEKNRCWLLRGARHSAVAEYILKKFHTL